MLVCLASLSSLVQNKRHTQPYYHAENAKYKSKPPSRCVAEFPQHGGYLAHRGAGERDGAFAGAGGGIVVGGYRATYDRYFRSAATGVAVRLAAAVCTQFMAGALVLPSGHCRRTATELKRYAGDLSPRRGALCPAH